MIALISGTNRPRSTTRLVADFYAQRLQAHGVAYTLIDLVDLPADFTATALYGNAGRNPTFNLLADRAAGATKLVFIVPEYNYSFPGVLKAFIDGLPYPGGIRNKQAALVGLSAGAQGGAVALSHLTDVLHYLGTLVLPHKPRLAHIDQHFREGVFLKPLYQQLLDEQIDALLAL
ncbi:MAG: NAD(P)H-dependent oxidoreductase [Hymenobacteraceae bacterium]|nr:NAD(P)H-dependent oxidoreductase [Hymenobacteraceae bacterium]